MTIVLYVLLYGELIRAAQGVRVCMVREAWSENNLRRTSRLLQAVTMPAAIGTERFLLIGVASLLHAKATKPPLI